MSLSHVSQEYTCATFNYGPPQITYHPEIVFQLIHSHPLTRPFGPVLVHHLANHEAGYILDLEVVQSICQIFKALFTKIHTAADPHSGPIKGAIAHILPPIKIMSQLFDDVNLPIPAILDIYPTFSANPLLIPNIFKDIEEIYKAAQDVGLEALKWIAKARLVCATHENQFGWHWADLDCECAILLQGPAAFNANVLVQRIVGLDI